jgi:hypothetical protein
LIFELLSSLRAALARKSSNLCILKQKRSEPMNAEAAFPESRYRRRRTCLPSLLNAPALLFCDGEPY